MPGRRRCRIHFHRRIRKLCAESPEPQPTFLFRTTYPVTRTVSVAAISCRPCTYCCRALLTLSPPYRPLHITHLNMRCASSACRTWCHGVFYKTTPATHNYYLVIIVSLPCAAKKFKRWYILLLYIIQIYSIVPPAWDRK